MIKILCVGDGFGKGHVHPMWPQILTKVVHNTQIDNLCEVGAGNEFIANAVIDACEHAEYDYVFVQWALSQRLDLINQNQNGITKAIVKDPTYNNKYSNVLLKKRSWWLSSASKIDLIKDYHKNYITNEQHCLRSIFYIKMIDMYLKEKKITNLFFSSYNLDFLDLSESKLIDWSNWHNEKIGMHEYGKKYLPKYTSKEIQPHTMVHIDYVQNVLCPSVGLEPDSLKLKEMRSIYA